jgi:hypothetical protein
VEILLHALDGPARVAPLDKPDGIPRADGSRAEYAKVPAGPARAPRLWRKVLELEPVVQLEAGLPREADLEEDGGGVYGVVPDGDDVADAEVPFVDVAGDEVLAKGAWLELDGRGGVLGLPGGVVGGAVCGGVMSLYTDQFMSVSRWRGR